MMQHYDLDGLIEYGAQTLPGTQLIVNPAWRELDKAIRTARQGERKQQSRAGKITLEDGADVQKKAESIEAMQAAQRLSPFSSEIDCLNIPAGDDTLAHPHSKGYERPFPLPAP